MGRPMKDSGVEWIGEIPADWGILKMKNISNIKRGASPRPIEKYMTDSDAGHNWIRIGDSVPGEKYITGTKLKVTDDGAKKSVKVNPGDLIMSNSMSIGRSYILTIAGYIHDGWLAFSLDEDKIDADWLSYVLNVSTSSLMQLAMGTTVNNLNIERVKSLQIPFYGVDLQRKIRKEIDIKTTHIDSIIEKTKASIDAFKRYKQALITETVTKGLEPDVSMKDSGIEWIGMIPEHWNIVKMNSLGSLYSAGVDKKTRDGEQLYKSVHYTDVYYNSIKEIGNKEDYLVISAKEDKARDALLLKGDTLFTTSSETPEDIGHSTVVSEDLDNTLMGYHLIRFRPQLNMFHMPYQKYLFGCGYMREWFSYRANGMTRYGLKREDFIQAPTIITPLEEQHQIATYLDEKTAHIDSLIQNKEAMIEKLEAYKKSLIYEYVTGKKEVE